MTTAVETAPDDDVIELTLPSEPSSAGAARGIVHNRWADLDEDVLADTELIVSELIANAVKHGEPEIVLRLRRAPFAIDVAVLDHGPAAPVQRPPHHTRSSGRGLAIIDKLALTWGVELLDHETGKIVWACIDRS